MKIFLKNIFLFSLLLVTSILTVFLLADGRSDSYYLRFTTPVQHSMVIGTSRSAQGLMPSILDSVIYEQGSQHFFNYSFSLFDSPFGPAYLKSIQRKLSPSVKDGIYIVAVDPWMLCDRNDDPDDSIRFDEEKSFMGKTRFVNCNPNLPYLIESYSEPYINIIRRRLGPIDMVLHKDGWLEVNVSMDSISVAKRLAVKLKDYRENFLPSYTFSAARFRYFLKTISFLQNHGTVYLVRLPAQEGIIKMENELLPDFERRMEAASGKFNVKYLSFGSRSGQYQYVDGNHLYKTSGEKLSREVANWIAGKK